MKHTGVPRIATWLLKRFGCSPKNDSLLGDLIEQRQLGRSRLWYWNEVVVAIGASLIGEIREHKLPTARAVAIGWSVPLLYGLGFHPFISEMLWRLEPWVVVQHPEFYHSYYRNLERFFWGEFSTGPLVELFAGGCLFGLLSGWLVARLNRANARAMVLTYAASILLYGITVETFLLITKGIAWIIFPTLLISNLASMLNVVSILAGGGLLRDSKRKDAFSATTT